MASGLYSLCVVACVAMTCILAYDISCDENEECADTTITTEISGKLECKGLASCVYSVFALTCTEEDCEIECGDDDACFRSGITMNNAKKVSCKGHEACLGISLLLDDVTEDFELKCEGDKTCTDAEVVVNGTAKKLECDGCLSCEDALMQLEIGEEFELTCKGANACANIEIDFVLSTDAEIDEIKCEGPESCNRATFTFQGTSGEQLINDELKCDGYQSCLGMAIVTIDADVTIKKCVCEEALSCTCATGLEICDELIGDWDQDASDTVFDSC